MSVLPRAEVHCLVKHFIKVMPTADSVQFRRTHCHVPCVWPVGVGGGGVGGLCVYLTYVALQLHGAWLYRVHRMRGDGSSFM